MGKTNRERAMIDCHIFSGTALRLERLLAMFQRPLLSNLFVRWGSNRDCRLSSRSHSDSMVAERPNSRRALQFARGVRRQVPNGPGLRRQFVMKLPA